MSVDEAFGSPESAVHHYLKAVDLPGTLRALSAAHSDDTPTILLDSSANGTRLGRYSFLALRPKFVIRIRRRGDGADVEVEHSCASERNREWRTHDPLETIRAALRAVSVPPSSVLEFSPPFIGGLVGYLSYEFLHFVENIADGAPSDVDLPNALLAACDAVFVYDHHCSQAFISVVGRGPDEKTALRHADELIEDAEHYIRTAMRSPSIVMDARSHSAPVAACWKHSQPRDAYLEAVEEILRRISAGDLYQVNQTFRMSRLFSGSDATLYANLQESNPAPFGAHLRFPEVSILSCSPERFLCMDSHGRIETRPMKGTRPRGLDASEDGRRIEELSQSVKDRSEHAMIVDLLRNDLGRVCDFHSVRVPEIMTIERHATVFQMVSSVVGRLRRELDVVDLVRATFPGGSMTGAPKIAAMKLISELERAARGVYSGCLGYFDARGGCDLSIVIRTAILHRGMAYVHAGGAIVADSKPEGEYDEAMLKAEVLIKTIDRVAAATEAEFSRRSAGSLPQIGLESVGDSRTFPH